MAYVKPRSALLPHRERSRDTQRGLMNHAMSIIGPLFDLAAVAYGRNVR